MVKRGGREDEIEAAILLGAHVAQVSQLIADIRKSPSGAGNLQHGRRDIDRQHLLEPGGENRCVVAGSAAEIDGATPLFRQHTLDEGTDESGAERSQAIVSFGERIEGLGRLS